VTVEHVHVHSGGQAVVGVVEPAGGYRTKLEDRCHAAQIAHAPQPEMWGPPPDHRQPCRNAAMANGRCRMHGGTNPGAPKGNRNAFPYTGEAIAGWCEVAALIRGLVTRGHAAGGHADYGSQDLYQACNTPAAIRRATMLQDRRDSVFAVWVKRMLAWERTGTATLIDDTGILLTAGHSVYFDKAHPIKITQRFHGVLREFMVKLISSPDNFQTDDYVLLQAEQWKNESRFPYPLRFDDSGLANGDFIGFEEEMSEEPVHRSIIYYNEDESGRHYQGEIFPNSSGALVYDECGRAFSIVNGHTPWSIDSLTDVPPEKVAEEWNRRATISVFPLERTIDTLKQNVPPSPFMKALIQDPEANVAPGRLPGDLNKRATPLDMILLIDEAMFGKVRQRWLQRRDAMPLLFKHIQAAADELGRSASTLHSRNSCRPPQWTRRSRRFHWHVHAAVTLHSLGPFPG
jgi:hypothetical protein